MKITGSSPWRALFEIAAGAAITCIASILLLFFTDLGDGMPDAMKIGLPVASWIAAMWFFFAHRSNDGKSVDFKIW